MGFNQIGMAIAAITLFITALIYGIKFLASPEKILRKYTGSKEQQNIFVKKYKEADVDYYRGPLTRLGFIAVLVVLTIVFNYSYSEKEDQTQFTTVHQDIIEQDVPVTQQVRPPEPPPPPPPPQIQIVSDERIIEEAPVFEELEVNLDMEIDVQPVKVIEVVDVPDVAEEPEVAEPEIFTVVEQQPAYPGGEAELMAYFASSINYPAVAQENGIQGTVVVRFVVDEKGGISDIQILRDIGGGCGAEAVRVVKAMPKWTPGRQRGKAVKVYFTLPVRFKLQ
jgi:protein TonB